MENGQVLSDLELRGEKESIATKRVPSGELFLVANFSATRQLTHNAESESFLRIF
jgi:hypothetical protein